MNFKYSVGDRVRTIGGNTGVIKKISGTGHYVVKFDGGGENAFEEHELKTEAKESLSFREQIILTEARNPKLKYQEKYVKNQLDRVTVALEGNPATVFTKLSKRYDTIVKAIAKLSEKRNDLNQDLSGRVEELFDAEDVLLTRVVETAKFTATLSKRAEATDKPIVDYQAIAEELITLIDQSLLPKITEIYAKYTTISKAPPAKAALRVKDKTVNEGIVDATKKLGKLISSLIKSVTHWAVGYDKQLDRLKKAAGIS